MKDIVGSPSVIVSQPLDLDQLRDCLATSRYVALARAAQLRDALGRQRTSKHLEWKVNAALLERLGLRAVRVGDEPVREHTAFVIYDRRSLVGRLVDVAHLPPGDLYKDVVAEVAGLEAWARARMADGVADQQSAGQVES